MKTELIQQMRAMTEAELFDALYTDVTTGAYNRRAFESKNHKWVAIVDADSLKWVNDNEGHRAGDVLLKKIVEALKTRCTYVYRLGGDEFAVSSSDPAGLIRSLEIIRATTNVFSFGIGKTLDEADKQLNTDKSVRERTGARAKRGEKPRWA